MESVLLLCVPVQWQCIKKLLFLVLSICVCVSAYTITEKILIRSCNLVAVSVRCLVEVISFL